MQNDEIVYNYLNKLGFDGAEIKVFLAVLENGAMTISDLSRKSGVERTALYRMLDSLEMSGLLRIREEHKRKLIYPATKESLKELIDRQELRLEHITRSKVDFLSKIEQLSGHQSSTKTEYYTGIESLKQLQWDMIKHRKGVLYSVMNAVFDDIFQMDFFAEWHKNQKTEVAKIIYSNPFIDSLRRSRSSQELDVLNNVEFYFVSPQLYKTTQYFEAYDDTVIYYNWGDTQPSAVLIKNTDTASSTKQLVDNLIKNTKQVHTWSDLRNTV